MDYNKHKIGVNKSDHMLAYYTLQSDSVKWWKKDFFHVFNLCTVNAHILCNKNNRRNIPLKLFHEMPAEGPPDDVWQGIQEWARGISTGRLTGNHFLYRILATLTKVKEQSQRTWKVQAYIDKHWKGSYKEAYDSVMLKCDVGSVYGCVLKITTWKRVTESDPVKWTQFIWWKAVCKIYLFLWTIILLYQPQDSQSLHPLTANAKQSYVLQDAWGKLVLLHI
jgi:hypothetical protein